jgi:amino acid transporter
VLYAGAAWAMSVGAGPDLAVVAAARGPEAFFDLAGARLTPWAVTLGRIVLVTGMVAAMVALHHTIARYMFALGRDRVLPMRLGETAPRTLAPRAASLTQSLVVGLVIGGCAYLDLDPQTHLARQLVVAGGIGVLVLLIAVSLAALLFLNRAPDGESAWRRFVAPGVATVAFGTLGYLAFIDFAELLGVRDGDPLTWIVLAAFGAVVLFGLFYALILRTIRPIVYAGIGLGGTAVVVSPVPPPTTRQPGAHRPERINRELTR